MILIGGFGLTNNISVIFRVGYCEEEHPRQLRILQHPQNVDIKKIKRFSKYMQKYLPHL